MGYQTVSSLTEGAAVRTTTRGLIRDLRALHIMLEEHLFERTIGCIGVEQEMFIVDAQNQPASIGPELIARSVDPRLTTEMMRFNLEVNLDPVPVGPDCLRQIRGQLDELIGYAGGLATEMGGRLVLTGMLPTAHLGDLSKANVTPRPRYLALDRAIAASRGGTGHLLIRGIDELYLNFEQLQLEGATSSFQVHFQVNQEDFARMYNIAQLIAGPVLGVSVNSPLLFGRRLWRETRIALFQQAMDTRRINSNLRESSPRVHFGNQWVRESVEEIFQEDALRFLPLLACDDADDALAALGKGEIPRLKNLQTHNSTVYRWSRPCYGISSNGKPHLRIENRMLPAGPTIADEVANGALWIGLMRGLADRFEDITREIDFNDVKGNFIAAARIGLAATMNWPGGRRLPLEKLLTEELLPVAKEGLDALGADPADSERYLDIIAGRVASQRTGAQWMVESISKSQAQFTRNEQLNMLVAAMIDGQESGEPVHTWPLAVEPAWGTRPDLHRIRIEHVMATDLFTINEEECIDLVVAMMEWRHIRHVLVENDKHRIVGLISQRGILRYLTKSKNHPQQDVPVRDLMHREVVTITPERSVFDAIALMRQNRIGTLPVVVDGQLVGLVTERDLLWLEGTSGAGRPQPVPAQSESATVFDTDLSAILNAEIPSPLAVEPPDATALN